MRQRQLCDQRRQDRPAHESYRDGEHVRHGRGQPPRAAPLANAGAAQADHRYRQQQRQAEFNGAPVQTTGGTVLELTADTHPIQREFFDFYRTPRGEFTPPGASPRTTTQPTLTSNVKFMNFYPFNDIETISPRPCCLSPAPKRIRESSAKTPTRRRQNPGAALGDRRRPRGPV